MANRSKIFPKKIADNVYLGGFNSPQSGGGKSYIVLHDGGNWMVGGPKYSDRLVQWLHSQGGLKYIFLTDRDALGEQYDYAWEFSAKRIIHEADLEAEPNAEIVIKGTKDVTMEGDFTIIPTPGHTPGHSMLLYQDEYLFTGDMLTANTRFGKGLEITAPYHCWWSWETQTESANRLKNFNFRHTLPAQGVAFSTNTLDEMLHEVKLVLEQCNNESDPDPTGRDRIEFVRRIADYAAANEQPIWAKIMRERARQLESRLAVPQHC